MGYICHHAIIVTTYSPAKIKKARRKAKKLFGRVSEVKVTITGTRPLLWNAFTPETLSLEKRERTGTAVNRPDEWREHVLALPDTRQLYLLPSYIFGSIREAARYTKTGRSTYQTRVAAALTVLDEVILIDRFLPDQPITDAALDVYLDVRSVRNPVTKARNLRYRIATKPGWGCSFTLAWDKTVVGADILHSIMIDAGNLVGVGDGRMLGMGRFNVQEFEVCRLESLGT